MLIHPSSGACDLFVELFHGLYCSGTILVGVTLWLAGVVWCGIRMQAYSIIIELYMEETSLLALFSFIQCVADVVHVTGNVWQCSDC